MIRPRDHFFVWFAAGGIYWMNNSRLALALIAGAIVLAVAVIESHVATLTRKIEALRNTLEQSR